MAILDSAADEAKPDDDYPCGDEPTEEFSLRDQLLQELMRAKTRKKEVAELLRELDSVDGEVLQILAYMIDGEAVGEPAFKAYFPFRIEFVGRQKHRPKRRSLDFSKTRAAEAAARLIVEKGWKVDSAFTHVATSVNRTKSYVKRAYYEDRRRRRSPPVSSI